MSVDLLDDFFSIPPIQTNHEPDEDTNYFTKLFWGEKNQGFDVLYHNMKHGQASVKSLQEFIRESSTSEEVYAKHLTKLAKQAANTSPLGTFAPMFDLLRGMSEKLSSCHMDIVHKLQDVTKELVKYLEEQKLKHKQVKDEVNATAVTLQQLQNTSGLVQKTKEKYHQLCAEAERLKRSGSALPKEIEKVEAKAKKASEEYRNVVEKYRTLRNDYEQKMSDSAKKFQELEVAHLKQMRNILETYILSFENANVLVGQVHQEFRRQISENTIDFLIRKFSEAKGTGETKPDPLVFEEYDFTNDISVFDGAQSDNVTTGDTTPPPPTQSSRLGIRPISLPFRRKKPRKQAKDSVSGSKDLGKESDSVDSPDKDGGMKVDEEGYTIRPDTPKETRNSWNRSSSGSDSDSDDFPMKKIQVKINPVQESNKSASNGNNLDALNAITKNLTLSSANVLGTGKKNSQNTVAKDQNNTATNKEKSSHDDILNLFSISAPNVNSTQNGSTSVNGQSNSADMFSHDLVSDHVNTNKSIPQSSSMNNLFVMGSNKDNAKENEPEETRQNNLSSPDSNFNAEQSRPFTLQFEEKKTPDFMKNSSAPITSSDSWSSFSSNPGTPVDNCLSSRGPSPLTLMQGDAVPIAVAFTEIVNAFFKGPNGEHCLVKVMGEVQMSFPSGIVRAFTSNPDPSALSFIIKETNSIQDLTPSLNFLVSDPTQSTSSQHAFKFDTSSLSSHIKKMVEVNPTAPYYNIPILKYQYNSQSGHNLAPLHLSASWKSDSSKNNININYKYNVASTVSSLSNVQVIVPISGGVADQQFNPPAIWNESQNRLLWKLGTPISNTNSAGTLNTQFTSSSGSTPVVPFAVQFTGEGSTLTGSDFELSGSGYRISLKKKRFITGKYLCAPN